MCLNSIEKLEKLLKTGVYQEKQDMVQSANTRDTQMLDLNMLCASLKEMNRSKLHGQTFSAE